MSVSRDEDTKSAILQIMPAGGWVAEMDLCGELHTTPLVGWALVRETYEDGDFFDHVVGLMPDDSQVVLADSISEFMQYSKEPSE